MSTLPEAVLLDLDDTILDDSSNVEACWREACLAHRSECPELDPGDLQKVIRKTGDWFWSDAERHRAGRLDLGAARANIVRLALSEAGIDRPGLAEKIAGAYAEGRESGMQPLPEAIETVRWLRERGCRLALVTNGAAQAQRRKIDRFRLGPFFDVILVEGEVGVGKPDARIYHLALRELSVDAGEAWMVGDNLEWDVAAPQKLGVFAIWIDARGRGVPETSPVRPNRIVRRLSEVRFEHFPEL